MCLSMEEFLFNEEERELRCARLSNGRLHDLEIERKKTRRVTGNIYRGKVTNILHNIQSAFIDIGEGENGFIHISDILENKKKFEQMFDMDFELASDEEEESEADIEEVLKPDQAVLVQVVKEAIGTKGARLTSRISVPGRYLVLLPTTPHTGVSRRIEDRKTRERLKRLIRGLGLPEGMGLICRTASSLASDEGLIQEAQELIDQWQLIRQAFQESEGAQLLFEESDLLKRTIVTAVDKKFGRVLVDNYSAYQRAKEIYKKYEAEHPLRIEYYRDKVPMFERFNVEREIDRALNRKVWLPSGGYLFFERTEAMVTIDINSGRSKKESKGSVEEALVQINMEAADEIAKQLRIRNVGGLIIVDFIDMRSRKSRRRVLERLRDAMKGDSAKTTILGMSEFGLVEMTRQRSRESLAQTMFCECPYCNGQGLIKTHESTSIELERQIKKAVKVGGNYALKVVGHPQFIDFLDLEEKQDLTKVADAMNCALEFDADDAFHLNEVKLYSTITGKEIDGI